MFQTDQFATEGSPDGQSVGLGIALLGLHLITAAADPVRNAPLLPQILKLLSNTPIFGVAVGAVLTVLSTSSLAIVLLVVSFMTAQMVPLELGLALVLGANLGSAVMPIMATMTEAAGRPSRSAGQSGLSGWWALPVFLPTLPLLMPYVAMRSRSRPARR